MNLSHLLPSLSPAQISQLERLADVFLEWNQKLNLSAIRDREGVLLKHIVDSLLILPFELIKDGNMVLDLGTGGGFPGLVLAIAYPKALFTLIDATEKKMKAVQAMSDELGLKNVRTLVGRAEELGRCEGEDSDPRLREQFDVVVARALAKFPTLLEYCMPFVKVDGILLAYQGPELLEKLSEYGSVANTLSAQITDIKQALLPIEDAQRSFIIVKKIGKIDNNYPRAVGIPKKQPLEP